MFNNHQQLEGRYPFWNLRFPRMNVLDSVTEFQTSCNGSRNPKELYEQECNGETVVYWEVKYPFPMSNRDVSFPQAFAKDIASRVVFGDLRYVYLRQRRDLDVEGRKIHVVLSQSTSVPQLGERSGVIRVKQYKQSLVIESDGRKGSKVFMYYFDNPGGQIPSWLINWAAKEGLLEVVFHSELTLSAPALDDMYQWPYALWSWLGWDLRIATNSN
ncbi:hypothetical protein P7K49_011384, partial [Saguinus oedipus]